LGALTPKYNSRYSNPQKAHPRENASFEPSTMKIHPGVRPGRVPENKKKLKQDRTTKKGTTA